MKKLSLENKPRGEREIAKQHDSVTYLHLCEHDDPSSPSDA